MSIRFLLRFILILLPLSGATQTRIEYGIARRVVRQNDTAILIQMKPVFVFGGKTKAKANATRKMYSRLIYNLKIVYPIAQEANATLKAMERRMAELPTEKEKLEFVKGMERALKRQYTPVLKNMTLSQGKLLIKLIDRETEHTSYDLVKQLRGGFRAFFWQGVAKIFGANLKDTYDEFGEDQYIEDLIMLYEAGLL